jgi:ABC-type uncharacterized transport system permease subunit
MKIENYKTKKGTIMKKIENILSWVAFCVILMTLCTVSIYGGACTANYLHDVWHMNGWECLVLIPVVIVVGLAICMFFMLGLKRVAIQFDK